MRLQINNIGKIEKATIQLNGLTVIAGENDTGKSTVGKLMFAIVKAFSRYEQDFNEDKKQHINQIIRYLYMHIRRNYNFETNKTLARQFHPQVMMAEVDSVMERSSNKDAFQFIKNKSSFIFDANLDSLAKEESIKQDKINRIIHKYLDQLQDLITTKEDKRDIIKRALKKAFISEFHSEISPKKGSSGSSVELTDGENKVFSLTINKNDIDTLEVSDHILYDDATFIESPIILQMYDIISSANTLFEITDMNKSSRVFADFEANVSLHLKDLSTKLAKSKLYDEFPLFDNENNIHILENISKIIKGDFSFEDEQNDFSYTINKKHKIKSINTASGIKSFGIIQLLLKADILNEHGLLIVDEPETHLHPKWQVDYAKVIVELARNNINILLTSHSPYMLQAIKVFSEQAQIADKVNFYLAESNSNNSNSSFSDVTNDLNRLFQKLSEPLQNIVWQ